DDLGRVVIPKEIRRTLRLREGTPLEIFTDREGEIIFKKYSPMAEVGTFAKQYAEALGQNLGYTVCISDRDQIIAAAGSGKRELLGRHISSDLENLMTERIVIHYNAETKQYIALAQEDTLEYSAQIIYPVICQGDVIGAVAVVSQEESTKFSEVEEKAILCAAAFLGKQMEA
ncbi:MAG: stage V sporulation T C-terminal domain-containing protein, partial [Lachnospiraceae bacterium]